jgi:hypothetical protein
MIYRLYFHHFDIRLPASDFYLRTKLVEHPSTLFHPFRAPELGASVLHLARMVVLIHQISTGFSFALEFRFKFVVAFCCSITFAHCK